MGDWLATLQMRAPHSRVLLCGTHKDKCVPTNVLSKLLAWLRRSPSIEAVMADVEQSIKVKHEQRRDNRRASMDEGLKLESGILLVSSSPTVHYCESGLPELQERLKECGEGTSWLIPPSWRLALVVLDAVRDGVNSVEAARHYVNPEGPRPLESVEKRSWIVRDELSVRWKHVQDSVDLPAELRPDDPEFALETAMDLR